MAIYIVSHLGSETKIFDALLTISRCDAGLSTTVHASEPALVVQFRRKGPSSFSSDRLLEIVNSSKVVWIAGVDDSFISPWGLPMVDYGGLTDVDITTSKSECSIWVDVTEAGGLGYRSLDSNGNFIYAPVAVMLFHELAHVYHGLIEEDTPGDHSNDQLLAIHDENLFRSQLGLPQRYPNVTIHEFTGPATVGPTSLKGCNESGNPWAHVCE